MSAGACRGQRHQIPWSWAYRWLRAPSYGCQEVNLDPRKIRCCSSPLSHFSSHLFLIITIIYFMCTSCLTSRIDVHHVCAWRPQRSEEGVRSFETGVWMLLHCWVVLGPKPGSSAQTGSALKHRATASASSFPFPVCRGVVPSRVLVRSMHTGPQSHRWNG